MRPEMTYSPTNSSHQYDHCIQCDTFPAPASLVGNNIDSLCKGYSSANHGWLTTLGKQSKRTFDKSQAEKNIKEAESIKSNLLAALHFVKDSEDAPRSHQQVASTFSKLASSTKSLSETTKNVAKSENYSSCADIFSDYDEHNKNRMSGVLKSIDCIEDKKLRATTKYSFLALNHCYNRSSAKSAVSEKES